MDPVKKIADFYDHYDRYIFNITNPKKNYHNLNYFLYTDPDSVIVKSDGIETKFGKHTINFQFSTDSPLFKIIRGIEEFCERKIIQEHPIEFDGYTFKSALYLGDNKSGKCLMYVKVPFRYDKCECEFVNKDGTHIQRDLPRPNGDLRHPARARAPACTGRTRLETGMGKRAAGRFRETC